MTFDPDEKLIELFKKHMELPKDEPDEVIQRSHEHNLEYCKWRVTPDGKVELGSDLSYKGKFLPLGFHHGQDDAMRRVENDFIIYVTKAREYILARIADGIQEMQSMKVTPASMEIPETWSLLLPRTIYGLSCTIGEKLRVFSEPKYGRFIELTL